MKDMDDINDEFGRTDVTVVIGANDVTNGGAQRPGLTHPWDADPQRRPVQVGDRAQAVDELSFAGIDNPLFYADGTTMLFGDAKKSVTEVAEELKAL